jgi:hypothetical protein
MDSRNTNEDEIDTEALQAQIDLSMSFAQNLVSSWVKPSRKLSNRNRDVEAELKEYMRRPPRWLSHRCVSMIANWFRSGLEWEHPFLRPRVFLVKRHD